MNLNLEIEQGSQADNIGKKLQQSTEDLAKEKVSNAALGVADIVASTGINAGVGSTDQIIADNIGAAVNLTGREGLTNLANNLQGYIHNLTEMGLNTPEELVNILLQQINEVLAEGGVIDQISKSMAVTKNITDATQQGLRIASSGITIAGNISKLMTQLNKMQDVEVTCIPTIKDSTSAFVASILDQIVAQYTALKEQLIIFYNAMICTSNDSVIDNIVASINSILTTLEPLLDQLLKQYTGFTVSEVRNICNQGFAYIGMIERAAARKQYEETENIENTDTNTEENRETTENN